MQLAAIRSHKHQQNNSKITGKTLLAAVCTNIGEQTDDSSPLIRQGRRQPLIQTKRAGKHQGAIAIIIAKTDS
tara:strand:+ start:319 stop:537 length:219 start_codon:yes stop_codon:yes gene_type:complete